MILPLPPLPEQYRIVTKIEELFTQLDAGVELLKKVKAKLKRYRQAVLKAAVEGELTAYWRTHSTSRGIRTRLSLT
jgi:type I restriction enzyme S subunit